MNDPEVGDAVKSLWQSIDAYVAVCGGATGGETADAGARTTAALEVQGRIENYARVLGRRRMRDAQRLMRSTHIKMDDAMGEEEAGLERLAKEVGDE